MGRTSNIILVISAAALLALTACSSSPTNENNANTDAPPAADAGTDAVPNLDAPAANPADPSAAASPAPGDAAPPAAAALDAPPPPADPTAAASPAPGTDPMAPPPAADAAAATPPAAATSATADSTLAPAPVDAPQAPAAPAPSTEMVTPGAPAKAAAPVATDQGDSEPYTVQRGDTLMKIAFETYGDLYRWKGIYEANKDKISDPNHVPPGTVINLARPDHPVSIERNGEKYYIKRGDTLGRISDDVYGTTRKWRRLWENNRQMIKDPNRIFAGFYLYYVMNDEDRRELEQFKSNVAPRPLSDNGMSPMGTMGAANPMQPGSASNVPGARAPAAVQQAAVMPGAQPAAQQPIMPGAQPAAGAPMQQPAAPAPAAAPAQ